MVNPFRAQSVPAIVVVKIGGAGVCRTDLHIIDGQLAEAMHPALPYTLGLENAGWVHELGSAVTNVHVGDTVILHPTPTCGLWTGPGSSTPATVKSDELGISASGPDRC